jgi:hypothetical protein
MSLLPVHHPLHTMSQPYPLFPTSTLCPHPLLTQLMLVRRRLGTLTVRYRLLNLVPNTHNFTACPPVTPHPHNRRHLLLLVFIPPRSLFLSRSLHPLDLLPETAHIQMHHMLVSSQQTDNRQPTTIQSSSKHLTVPRSEHPGLFKGPRYRYLERTSICETITLPWRRLKHNSVKCSHKTTIRSLVHLRR